MVRRGPAPRAYATGGHRAGARGGGPRPGDGCRSLILAQLSEGEKAGLLGDVAPHAAGINDGLDGYPGEAIPAEAAAFMYLPLALEELGG
ncbi:MAG: hypothetical protein ACOZDY_01095 [Pseudomonadota bacterium]